MANRMNVLENLESKMIDEAAQIDGNILEMKAKKKNLLKDIKRFKTENGMKVEAIARLQEKKYALMMEAQERDKEEKELQENMKQILANNKDEYARKTALNQAKDYDYGEEREKLKEKFLSLLENKMSNRVDKYITNYLSEIYAKQSEEDGNGDQEKVYAKSSVVHTVMVCLEEEVIETGSKDGTKTEVANEDTPLMDDAKVSTEYYVTTFRVSQETENIELKEAACAFWGKKLSDYDFFDEKMEEMNDKEKDKKNSKLEKYWRHRKNNYNQVMILMKKKKKKEKENDKPEEVKLQMRGNDDEDEAMNHQHDPYHSYELLLPKLVPYISINQNDYEEKIRNTKRLNEPEVFGENHCCIFTFLVALLMLILVSILSERSLVQEFYTIEAAQQLVGSDNFLSITSVSGLVENGLKVLTNFFPQAVDDEPDRGGDSSILQLYKPIVFYQYRVRQRLCSFANTKLKCYYETYSKDTRETESFFNGGTVHNFSFYKPEKPIDGTLVGSFGEYDLEAYKFTFDQNKMKFDYPISRQFIKEFCRLITNSDTTKNYCLNYTKENHNSFFGEVENGIFDFDSRYINASTRALRISLNLYDVINKKFIFFEPLLEFTPAGTILTSVERLLIFRPNLTESNDAPVNLINIAIVIFTTFLLIFVLYTLFTTGNGGINLSYFITLQGFMNVLIIVLCYLVHSLVNKLNGYEVSEFVLKNNSGYTNLRDLATLYEQIFNLKALTVGVLVIRVAFLLKLHTRIEMIVTSLEHGIPQVAMMTLFLSPIVLSLAFLTHYMIGIYNERFNSYGKALTGIIALLIGNESDLLQTYAVAENLTEIIGFFFLYFMIFNFFSAISVENFRQTMLEYGEDYHKKFTWKPNDYVKWSLAWIPKFLRRNKLSVDLQQNLKLNNLKNLANLKNMANLKNINLGKNQVTGAFTKVKNIFKKKPKKTTESKI